ncbi:sensor histidine kinase [Amedibacillus dolichus]|uniref:sensor histidine kinase n=1 Tax=Amedibacillus dolichus TaxID=31971 RepID=UPI00241DE7BF|nr:histidine kinase [Amedibacillus dolichus]
MRKNGGKKKFKNQIFIYSFFIIVLIILTITFFTLSNRSLMQEYHLSYKLYDYLGDFYEDQSKANDCIRNYLYTGNKEEYEKYEKIYRHAKESVKQLKHNDRLVKEAWRIDLLENMLESYQEQAERVVLLGNVKDSAYGKAYDKLLEINDTILKTSDDYYQIITKAINETLENIDMMKNRVQLFTIAIVAISIGGVILYAWIIRRSILHPIDELVDNMKEIKEGSFDFKRVKVNNEELEVLCVALQDLYFNIHQNMEHEKEKSELKNALLLKENENLKKDELLATSELKMLQSQINPHFLFNAMNMIYQEAILEASPVTIEMIEKMTECMRYTLSQNSRTSTLHMELSFVENYIYIQNKRFEGRIHFELVMEDELPNIRIPSMIIEPLIDNAVKHGLANTETDGLVAIHVSKSKEFIYINVSDNGCGMPSEELEALVMNDFTQNSQQKNIGLNNLKRRLSMYYSNRASITVNSVEDCGFEVLISIPIQ